MLRRRLKKPIVVSRKVVVKPRDIATNEDIENSLKKMNDSQAKYLKLLILTGRRSCDILRISWESIKFRKGNCCVVIPRDKTSKNNLVSFEVKFSDWDLSGNVEELKKWLLTGSQTKSGNIFPEKFQKQNVARKCKFRVHSLRNRRAIIMLINGSTEAQVMSHIGWTSCASLLRYAKVSVSFIKNFENYNEFCSDLLSR